mmetsp:Transcript_19795/g.64349  ORF Transcript_19795/g.64349 Transcript_19795/m.64349 type:complete len:261 (-) Transcript_19795:211-993(-)
MRMSKSLQRLSVPPVRSQLPLRFHLAHVTTFLWQWSVPTAAPPRGSQSLTRASFDADTTSPLVGCQSTAFTSPPCPASVCSTTARAVSQMRTVASSPPEQNLMSVGANAKPRTGSLCPPSRTTRPGSMLRWRYIMTPASSALMNQSSLCIHAMVRIARSWPSMMFSNLNVCPFQSVNCPLWQPERSQRPSGVHTQAFIDVRSLLLFTCTNFVVKLVAGLVGYPLGGSRSTELPSVGCRASTALSGSLRGRFRCDCTIGPV